MENETTIFLTEKDAILFKQFLEYYDIFAFLLEKKVFDQKAAGITINFDNQGRIGSITRADVLYLTNVKFDNTNEKV